MSSPTDRRLRVRPETWSESPVTEIVAALEVPTELLMLKFSSPIHGAKEVIDSVEFWLDCAKKKLLAEATWNTPST
ncbi:hypothetical protein R1flu_020758 [Riccia fluitans]|uniref:Uncharacterized protein n=1 Tax=Riccia fluitans TaxID=41844 RepID=A0ABD1ZMS1_9MARC